MVTGPYKSSLQIWYFKFQTKNYFILAVIMKNAFILLLVALFTIFLASCQKCYQCHNQCQVCRKVRYDTTLTIIVYSQLLTEQYYTEYIDSLTSPSLGWVCRDTTSTYVEQYCQSDFNGNAGLFNEAAKGLICTQ
jgi:hypothetical protein